MSVTTPKRAAPPAGTQELAARIYVELLGGTLRAEAGTLKFAADAEALAVLSVRLAETFREVEDKASASRAPNSPFELDASNFAQWSAGTPPLKG